MSQRRPTPLSVEQQQKFDLAISLHIAAWPALSLAVANNWGGPNSSEKRDWLAGVISDLFVSEPETDEQDVQEVLLQVLMDEFDVDIDDDSEEAVAIGIMKSRHACEQGDYLEIQAMFDRWTRNGSARNAAQIIQQHQAEDDSEDTDGSEDDNGGVEVDMMDAQSKTPPQLVRPRADPEIDEDGFTKVASRKKR